MEFQVPVVQSTPSFPGILLRRKEKGASIQIDSQMPIPSPSVREDGIVTSQIGLVRQPTASQTQRESRTRCRIRAWQADITRQWHRNSRVVRKNLPLAVSGCCYFVAVSRARALLKHKRRFTDLPLLFLSVTAKILHPSPAFDGRRLRLTSIDLIFSPFR
jgi:hypothetical protein